MSIPLLPTDPGRRGSVRSMKNLSQIRCTDAPNDDERPDKTPSPTEDPSRPIPRTTIKRQRKEGGILCNCRIKQDRRAIRHGDQSIGV
ncbi:hypothetical protein EYC84_003612 [Monilinia fructicola]|uniref:Uncharacterized protein n=1 Tax=Monilinia fructicola TaxID=38448 RepID=A0A5M9JZE0_MONFR|nr:hypothetical protein EYC84_003612 [Monilinia fructicola]